MQMVNLLIQYSQHYEMILILLLYRDLFSKMMQ